jgi:hypothetical protein
MKTLVALPSISSYISFDVIVGLFDKSTPLTLNTGESVKVAEPNHHEQNEKDVREVPEVAFEEGVKWEAEQNKYTKFDVLHLEWIYNRMIEVHNENPNYDFMIKFKQIIAQNLK